MEDKRDDQTDLDHSALYLAAPKQPEMKRGVKKKLKINSSVLQGKMNPYDPKCEFISHEVEFNYSSLIAFAKTLFLNIFIYLFS